MTGDLRGAVEKVLGCGCLEVLPLVGGDICEAFLVTLESNCRVFVKTRRNAPPGMFESEARGLAWLAESGSLRVPQVLAHRVEFLILEHLESAPRPSDFDQKLGCGLAALHRFEATEFGWESNNFIGTLPQKNTPCSGWAEFYAERRLRPLLERAASSRLTRSDWSVRFEKVFRDLPARLPDEFPSRLHGDLWAGNLLTGPQGEPCLIDPSVYGGHREMDLAMMRLFGGFGSEVFAAYQESFPLLAGHSERVPLYQLYPMLVHLNLFGPGYADGVEQRLRAWENTR